MHKHTIFWVDDDPDDIELFIDVMNDLHSDYNLICFHDGSELLNYLSAIPENTLPCLIVLDMNMPVMDGRQTLATLKGCASFSQIPVVVVTTSGSENDRSFCRQHQAEMFTKPTNYDALKRVVGHVLSYCHPNKTNLNV